MEMRDIILAEGKRSINDQSYVKQLVNKWGELLEGVENPYTKGVTAMLMENQSAWLQGLDEETKTSSVGSFTKFIFPVLRRVFPNLIANEIVSVQPMSASIGAVFFYDYVYASSKGGVTAGDTFPNQFNRNYTSEYIDSETLASDADGTKYNGGGAALAKTLTWVGGGVRPLNTSEGYKVEVVEVDATTGADVQVATDNGSGGFDAGASAGAINYTTGAITAFKFAASAPVTGNLVIARYFYDSESSSQIAESSLVLTKEAITARTRKLKTKWSVEAAEDLRSFHGLDAETELVSMASQEMALEIDREIVQSLFANSTGNQETFDMAAPAGISEVDHIRSMLTKISIVSSKIHTNSLRAPGNFIVTSPAVTARLSQLTTHGDYRAAHVSGGASPYGPADMPKPISQHGQFGIYKVGTLHNKWVVYEDPYFTENKMLIGLKGNSYLDAGYVWAPYVPLMVSATFANPGDLTNQKALHTRYATKLLRSSFYGRLTITNM
jgi:hypothetical protein